MVQSGFDRTVLQPDWRRGQNRVLEMTEMEERWVVRAGKEEERRHQAMQNTAGGGEG